MVLIFLDVIAHIKIQKSETSNNIQIIKFK